MTEQSNQWSEIGDRLEALALKLKLHFEQSGRSEEVPDVLRKLKTAVGEAFDAAGNAVRDDAVRADVKETGKLVVDAVSTSLLKVSEELKVRAENLMDRTTKKDESKPADAEPAASEPAPAEPAAPESEAPKPIDPA